MSAINSPVSQGLMENRITLPFARQRSTQCVDFSVFCQNSEKNPLKKEKDFFSSSLDFNQQSHN